MRGGYLFEVKPSRNVVLQHPAVKHSSECRGYPGGRAVEDRSDFPD